MAHTQLYAIITDQNNIQTFHTTQYEETGFCGCHDGEAVTVLHIFARHQVFLAVQADSNQPYVELLEAFASDALIHVLPAEGRALASARVQNGMNDQEVFSTHSYKPVTFWNEFKGRVLWDLSGRGKNVEMEMIDGGVGRLVEAQPVWSNNNQDNL